MAKIRMNAFQESTATLQGLFDDYITRCRAKNLSEATIKSYGWQLNVFTRYLPAETPISEITEEAVKSVITRMLEDGNKPISINTMLRHMNSIFSSAAVNGLIGKSPRVPFLKVQEEVKDTYTDQEIITLLKKPDTRRGKFREFRTWAIINTLVATGIRLKTVGNIRILDIDFDNGMLKLSTLKTKKVQMLPLSQALAPTLREYLRVRKGAPDDYLFCTESGSKLSDSTIYHDIVDYNTARGVTKTSVHLFRHTFAKHFVIAGGDPIRLQKWLGHSTLDMTRRYCNLFDTDLKDNAERFNLLDSVTKQKKIRV